MTPRLLARLAGVLYFLTHVTSVAAVALYGGSGIDPDAVLSSRQSVLAGALLDIVLAVAVVGTAVALYPLVQTSSPGVAIGYLALRTLEASVIVTGAVLILAAVARPATEAATALDAGSVTALRLLHEWTFLIGPGLVVPVHTVLLAWFLRRRGLVPRFIPVLGLVGGPLVGVMNLGVMFGFTGVLPLAVVPVFAWEITLAGYLVVRGLRDDPSTPRVSPTRLDRSPACG